MSEDFSDGIVSGERDYMLCKDGGLNEKLKIEYVYFQLVLDHSYLT